MTTKADRVNATNPEGDLWVVKLAGRQFLQAPIKAFPSVKADMVFVRSSKCHDFDRPSARLPSFVLMSFLIELGNLWC